MGSSLERLSEDRSVLVASLATGIVVAMVTLVSLGTLAFDVAGVGAVFAGLVTVGVGLTRTDTYRVVGAASYVAAAVLVVGGVVFRLRVDSEDATGLVGELLSVGIDVLFVAYFVGAVLVLAGGYVFKSQGE